MNPQKTSKLIALIILLSVILSSTLTGQAASSAAPASPAVNLSWFYKPPADGNLSLIASNFTAYIMTKGNEGTRDQLIGLGVKAPFLEYLRFEAIMDPGSCTVKPWQNNVAFMPGDFCDISANHPDWFLLDASGQRIMSLTNGDTPFYLMDPGSAGWRAFFLQRVQQIFTADPVWAGVFLDNVEVTNKDYVKAGETLQKYPDNASFQAAIQGFLQYLRTNFFAPNGKLLYANLISRTDDALFTSYMTHLDGAMHEGWAVDDPNRWRTVSEWEKHMNLVEQAQGMGKPLFLVSHGAQTDTELQQFAFASYLLVSDGSSSFRYIAGGSYNKAWLYDNYQLPLGAPLGPRFKEGTAWKRNFANGSVSVDPGTHAVSIKTGSAPTATKIAPTATKTSPTATKTSPTATKTSPTATKAAPTATKVAPTATKAAPTATKAAPTATKAAPTATKAAPTATKVAPTATKVAPTSTKVAPTATKVAPTSTSGTTHENTNPAFVYSSGWKTVETSKASAGSYVQSTTLKSSITLKFTGTSLKVAYVSQPKGGKMQVLVDGKLLYTINQKSSSTKYIQTWRLPAGTLAPGQHTLTLVFDNPAGSIVSMDRVTIY